MTQNLNFIIIHSHNEHWWLVIGSHNAKKYQLSCFYLPSVTLKYALSRSAANMISLSTNVIRCFFTNVHIRVIVSSKEYILFEHQIVVIDIYNIVECNSELEKCEKKLKIIILWTRFYFKHWKAYNK